MPAAVLAGDGFRAVHETREQSSRGVECTTVAAPRQGDERRESYLRIWRTLRRLLAAMPTSDIARASESKEPARVA